MSTPALFFFGGNVGQMTDEPKAPHPQHGTNVLVTVMFSLHLALVCLPFISSATLQCLYQRFAQIRHFLSEETITPTDLFLFSLVSSLCAREISGYLPTRSVDSADSYFESQRAVRIIGIFVKSCFSSFFERVS